MAKAFAEAQYEQFNTARIGQSDAEETDFDRVLKQLPAAPRRKSKAKE